MFLSWSAAWKHPLLFCFVTVRSVSVNSVSRISPSCSVCLPCPSCFLGVTPGLAVVLVGSRKDSETYVRSKKKGCAEAGIESYGTDLPETATEEEVLKVGNEMCRVQNYSVISRCILFQTQAGRTWSFQTSQQRVVGSFQAMHTSVSYPLV